MATYSSILVWKIPWTKEPGRLQTTGYEHVHVCNLFYIVILYTSAIHWAHLSTLICMWQSIPFWSFSRNYVQGCKNYSIVCVNSSTVSPGGGAFRWGLRGGAFSSKRLGCASLSLTGQTLAHQFGCAFSSVQSLSRVWLLATKWIAARQASLSITNSRSLPKPMPIESVMPSSHLILCCPLLLLPQSLPDSGSFPVSQLFAWGGH